MKNYIKKILNRSERGQAIILVAFAIVGLIAMVGLVTDTGLLLINYGRLKRGVDAAAVAAAQQYRIASNGTGLDPVAVASTAKNFLDLNQAQNVTVDYVHTCESAAADRPSLCNPINGPVKDNRKLVEVKASSVVNFGFLSVIGIRSTTISSIAIGEAASLDVVLVIDTSLSMAYETGVEVGTANPYIGSDSDDDPSVCNLNNSCQPMAEVKATAKKFIKTLYFPYDRVGIVTMTHITPGNPDGSDYNVIRSPQVVLPLSTNTIAEPLKIENAIDSIKVFEPRDCEPDHPGLIPIKGVCLKYDGGTWNSGTRTYSLGNYLDSYCQYAQFDPLYTKTFASCPSSNVGGALNLAKVVLTGNGVPANKKLDAFWVVVAILSGPANATNTPDVDTTVSVSYPDGYCPEYTAIAGVPNKCRDTFPSQRHPASATTSWTYPLAIDPDQHIVNPMSLYDADDYARDSADSLAKLISGDGVTIYTIGLGKQVQSTTTTDASELVPVAESLLRYIAECAGEGIQNCPNPPAKVPNPVINHGQYFYSPNTQGLANIFLAIANNIATKLSK